VRTSGAGGVPAIAPSRWVERFLPGVAPGGTVLDVACGSGRHFAPVLAAGCRVVGVDRDLAAARHAWSNDPRVSLVEADLETGDAPPFRGQQFAGVVVTNYLWRQLFPDIIAAVAEDGLLIYETFMQGQERIGRPSRPEFLLRPGELLEWVAGRLAVVAFEHVRLKQPDRLVQRIVAAGRRHPWPATDAPPPG